MTPTILLLLAPALAPSSSVAPGTPPALVQDPGQDAEVEKRLAAAGDDVAKLLEVAEWCQSNDKAAEARNVYKKILEIDADHEEAHKALRHHFYDGQWFTSYVALSKYKREEAKRMREEHGLVRFGNDWVPEADVPYLRMGWVKDESGKWVSQHVLDELAEVAKLKEEGYVYRPHDMSWTAPDELEKVQEGLWKCGEEWLPLDEANAYHAEIGQWWSYPGDQFVVLSTCEQSLEPRDSGVAWAAWHADQTYPELVRALGIMPQSPPEVVVLHDQTQYNSFAGGDQGTGRQPTEATGASSTHYAYFTDAWFDVGVNPPAFKGVGVSFWDRANESMAAYGPYSIRHAAALSFLEAVDPSWEAVSLAISSSQPVQAQAFWGEKKIKPWFRFGLASYCERYMADPIAPQSAGPYEWTRNWALSQLREQGGPRPLTEIFAFNFDPNDPDGSRKLLCEAGMVVAFVLDGTCAPVRQKHAAFKAALKGNGDPSEAMSQLEQAIVDNEVELRLFANF